jgi:hypothetical protein
MKPEESDFDPESIQLTPISFDVIAKCKGTFDKRIIDLAQRSSAQWCEARQSFIWQQDAPGIGLVWCEATRQKFRFHVSK